MSVKSKGNKVELAYTHEAQADLKNKFAVEANPDKDDYKARATRIKNQILGMRAQKDKAAEPDVEAQTTHKRG